MRILFVAAEVAPFAKVGGLADVAGSLPKALAKLGHDVKVVMPLYRHVNREKWGLEKILENWEIARPVPSLQPGFNVYRGYLPGSEVEVWFIDNGHYFHRPEIYMEGGRDYPDNPERYAFFSRAVMALVQGVNWQPDIMHCHDWQTALLPTYQKLFFMDDPFWKSVKTVFTIHNLAYQGIFDRGKLPILGLPDWTFTPQFMEFYGNLCLMKGGLICSDKLTTVSPRYSREIQSWECGCGLDGVLRERQYDLSGILNGVDYDQWNPQKDSEIAAHFSEKDWAGKQINKINLLKDHHLPVSAQDIPVIGIISRLADQKGFDILAEVAERLMTLDMQMVVLGTGEQRYHDLFKWLAGKYPEKVAVNLKFDGYLAKMIYAGSDLFLMSSKYEPCGLGQLIAMAYGTVPIVRSTGGLADTVRDFNPVSGEGNGFSFDAYSGSELLVTVERALSYYHQKPLWERIRKNAIRSDYSWTSSARQYSDLYRSLIH